MIAIRGTPEWERLRTECPLCEGAGTLVGDDVDGYGERVDSVGECELCARLDDRECDFCPAPAAALVVQSVCSENRHAEYLAHGEYGGCIPGCEWWTCLDCARKSVAEEWSPSPEWIEVAAVRT
jgi:hypothetical protein